jgi:RIO kinase 1
MDFVGVNGSPCRSLLTSNVNQNDYDQAISLIKDLYHKAKLVHGDFSEYNIFKTDNGLIVFDLGSAVDLRHPNSKEFLKRDINNITRFFKKKGMNIEDSTNVYEDIVNEL